MSDNRNLLLAIALSVAVLGFWEFFYGMPQREKAQRVAEQNRIERGVEPAAGGSASQPGVAPQGGTPAGAPVTRETAVAASQRIGIDTPRLKGSLSLRGARIDDLSLKDYRETVSPTSANIVLLSPAGSPHPYYAEFGWVAGAGASVALPTADTVWTQDGQGALTPTSPVTLRWDNGAGLTFRRTVSVDKDYMFSVAETVQNSGSVPVSLAPYALVSRHGRPVTSGFFILHEGLVGYFGGEGLKEVKYGSIEEQKSESFQGEGGWLGITDKYWATAIVPPQVDGEKFGGRFVATDGAVPTYQADYTLTAKTVAPGASAEMTGRLFVGAKEVALLDAYQSHGGIPRFELLIDWGWFFFITKPMFYLIDFIYKMIGNFGVAILVVTVIVKLVFFPLANKSYVSMSKMKLLQPEMMALRERFPDDRAAQQKAMMELYKREKVNPVAGCLPVVIQIPVFFALYKVLFVTIEMRHAPFFGWIRDLSAPDPTTVFNLFGLIPWDPGAVPVIGHFLLLGAWPLVMGVTMWLQMRLNPTPPDPTQQMIFNWMPVIFTFMLGSFPAGLVIYWSWNNTLSILQQSVIMRRAGVKIELWDNVKALFTRKRAKQGG